MSDGRRLIDVARVGRCGASELRSLAVLIVN